MVIKVLKELFSVCKLRDLLEIDWSVPFTFVASTDEENSLVCPSRAVPQNCTEREDDWRAFRIEGILEFSLVGIMSAISGLLAQNNIPIFVVSTFHTDYFLVKEVSFSKALKILSENGYTLAE